MNRKPKVRKQLEEYVVKSAHGVKGILLGLDEDRSFRVYNKKKFSDYQLATCDLSVTIDDSDAFFWVPKDGSRPKLDFSPATLGLDRSAPSVSISLPPDVAARVKENMQNPLIKVRTYIPGKVYDALESRAEREGIPMERLVRKLLEDSV